MCGVGMPKQLVFTFKSNEDSNIIWLSAEKAEYKENCQRFGCNSVELC